jgi:hypothetical protein
MRGHLLVMLQFSALWPCLLLDFRILIKAGRQEQFTRDCSGKEVVWFGSQNIGTQ